MGNVLFNVVLPAWRDFLVGGKDDHLVGKVWVIVFHKIVFVLPIQPAKRRVNEHGQIHYRFREDGFQQTGNEDLFFAGGWEGDFRELS